MIDWSQLVTADEKARIESEARGDFARAEALGYLARTDWYAIRAAETGKPAPDDVVAGRSAAREMLDRD